MAGIERLKDAVKLGIGLTEGVVEKAADGKITFWDVIGLAPELVNLPGLVQDADELWGEFQDLDEAELDELIAFADAEFDIPNDNTEEVVEAAFDVLGALADLYFKLKPKEEPVE